jgi:hypothetical protein
VLTNMGSGSPIDLDSIVFETQIGSAKCVFSPLICVISRTFVRSETITLTALDDTSPDITYLPTPTDWVSLKTQGTYNGTIQYVLHSRAFSSLCLCFFTTSYTQVGGAQAQLMFNGVAVAVLGTVSPDHADYTVTMDGVTQSFQGGSNRLNNHLHFGVSTLSLPSAVP